MNLYVYEFIHMYAEDVPPVAAAANVLGPPGVADAGIGLRTRFAGVAQALKSQIFTKTAA